MYIQYSMFICDKFRDYLLFQIKIYLNGASVVESTCSNLFQLELDYRNMINDPSNISNIMNYLMVYKRKKNYLMQIYTRKYVEKICRRMDGSISKFLQWQIFSWIISFVIRISVEIFSLVSNESKAGVPKFFGCAHCWSHSLFFHFIYQIILSPVDQIPKANDISHQMHNLGPFCNCHDFGNRLHLIALPPNIVILITIFFFLCFPLLSQNICNGI